MSIANICFLFRNLILNKKKKMGQGSLRTVRQTENSGPLDKGSKSFPGRHAVFSEIQIVELFSPKCVDSIERREKRDNNSKNSWIFFSFDDL